MDTSGIVQSIILIVLLLLSGFFSSAETAFTIVGRIRMEALLEEGNKKAEKVLKLLNSRTEMLTAILIMNNLINLSASSITTTLALKFFGSSYIALATGILTFVLLIVGEISPKSIATMKAEEMALSYSGIVYFIVKLLKPVVFIVDKVSNLFIRMSGVDPSKSRSAMTEYELRSVVETSHEDGVIETEEREMINNVVDFGDSFAKDIMIPRVEMCCFSVDATFDDLKDIYDEKKYTRIPVYEETTDNIVGVLHMKDCLFIDKEDFDINKLMRKPSFTFEYKKTSDLLVEMRQNSISMIFVLDEYGATVGLITLEDLLEEIVGEIRDEFDDDEKNLIKHVSEKEYIIDGSMKLDDINNAIETSFYSDEYDTISGLLIEKLEHIPDQSEATTLDDGTKIRVIKKDKNRIEKVKITLPDTIDEDLEEDEKTQD